MKAVVYSEYGSPDVLSLANVLEPARKVGHVRVRVQAAALNPKDILVRKGRLQWFVARRFPRTPGYDIAGTLIDDAPDLPSGTEVCGMIQDNAGGGCAEIVSLPPDQIARKPDSLSMQEAAALPLAALTALQALRDHLQIRPGQRLLLNGASGGVGTFAVQIAKALNVPGIAVCSSRNTELVSSLGAAEVIDYTQHPPSDQTELDRIFDIYGSFPWPVAHRSLRRGGRYCTTIPSLSNILRTIGARVGLHRASLVIVRSNRADLEQLTGWVDTGELRPVVDRVFRLEDSAEAHRYMETRRSRGKVVFEVG